MIPITLKEEQGSEITRARLDKYTHLIQCLRGATVLESTWHAIGHTQEYLVCNIIFTRNVL